MASASGFLFTCDTAMSHGEKQQGHYGNRPNRNVELIEFAQYNLKIGDRKHGGCFRKAEPASQPIVVKPQGHTPIDSED